ncbi:MAG: DNA recombination protein RmuC [Clostridia bacterium]|nr:DNA recombination protein RmuC [Clostridia bacterium]
MELYIIIGLLAVVILLLVILLTRKPNAAVFKELADTESRLREELRSTRRELSDALKEMTRTISEGQKETLKAAGENQDKLNAALTTAVKNLQESNEKKLDQMRETVDEKLQSTLTKRLDSSFKTVGEQLQNVYKSLGEMKELAGGVSDLQRVLSNVKARGTWAEVQLGNILEQTLTHEQYDQNVSTRNNNERVEFAIRIPSRDDDGAYVWLPIDSKFPQEDYVRLCDAAEKADKDGVEAASKALERVLKSEAKTIADLYIEVPKTTDFAIMFLPTEGLYAEVLRRPGLMEELQNKYRIMVCGPTTITAFLNTLRMGFRTLAIDKRAAEVWKVLGAAKMQYDKFEGVLAKAKKKIDEAGSALDDAQPRNDMIRRKLNKVEEVDSTEVPMLLSLSDAEEAEE